MHEITSRSAPHVEIGQVRCVEGYECIRQNYPDYLSDESKLSAKPFDRLYFPRSEAELAAVIRESQRRGESLTIAGARTGLVGGWVPPGGALVSLEFLDQVEAVYYDPASQEWRLRAQAGVSLKDLERMLRHRRFPTLEDSQEEEVQRQLERFKQEALEYFYPPDPTEMSASLGGSVVTNASGARTYRYGPTRAWVRGLRVFLANGEYLDIPRGKYFASPAGQFVVYNAQGEGCTLTIPEYPMPRTKSAAGFFSAPQMDLIDLFIGSEGLLGVVSRVDVALLPRQEKISIIQFLDGDERAIRLMQTLRADARLRLDFLEFYSGNALRLLRKVQKEEPSSVGMPPIPEEAHAALFLEMSFNASAASVDFSALEEAVLGCGGDPRLSWAGYEERELERFKVFRHLLPETINRIIAERKKQHPGLHKLGTDLAVPDEHLEEIWALYRDGCESAGLEWVAFGHIGNNHIHVNILPRNQQELEKGMQLYGQFARRAVEMGGSVSAEHGIGKIKSKFLALMFLPSQLEQMRRIKTALDPQGMFNPEDMFLTEAQP